MQTKGDLTNLLRRAWKVREAFFPAAVQFAAPNRTLAVSVTGSSCVLNCSHCGGHYLKGMLPLEKVLSGKRGREKSYLVSGGSDQGGRVPLSERWAELEELAGRGPLNLHTGLVNEEESKRLSHIARVVSFDFVGDDETIGDVYHLPMTVKNYLASYRSLQKYNRVIPHICLGINAGQIRGEYNSLRLLRQEAVEAISMIIFRPTVDTAFSDCSPPLPENVARFIATARLMFPRTPLYLGCMRPGGSYREAVDTYALEAGINKIVLPAPAARARAVDLGLEISISEECCSL